MRLVLGLAVAASILAYVLAYLTPAGPSPLSFAIAGGLFLVTLPSRAIRWDGSAARFVRPVRLALILLLVAAAALTIVSRQIYLMYDQLADRFGFILGDLLGVMALVLFYGRRHWAVATSLLPACAGLLVLASLKPRTPWFLELTVVAALCLWTWAVAAGGPKRRGPALAAFVLAGAGLAAATTQFLPWAAPQVGQWLVQNYGDPKTGLSDQSALGEFSKLATSRRPVARVFTREPVREPLLLRMKVFDQFNGQRWTSRTQPARTVAPSASAVVPVESPLTLVPGSTFELAEAAPDAPHDARPGPRRAPVEARVVLSLGYEDGWGLLVPAGASVARLPGASVGVDGFGHISTPEGLPGVYGAARPGRPLDTGPPSAGDLEVPPDLPAEVRAIAESLGSAAAGARPSNGPSNAEKLARTVAFLHDRPFRYTLEPGAFRTRTPLVEFLLEKKAGYCEYFASAAAILLRLQGVPARFVKGVSVRAESLVGGHHLVRESDAHAWVEAWVPGEGWVEADPTPPGDYAALHASAPPDRFEQTWEAVLAWVASAWAWLKHVVLAQLVAAVQKLWETAVEEVRRRPQVLVVVLLLGLLGLLSPRLLRRVRGWWAGRRERQQAEAGRALVPSGLRALVVQVERQWESAGWPRPPARGLREHLQALPAGAIASDALALSEAVVDSYYQAAFGGRPPSEEDLAALTRRVE